MNKFRYKNVLIYSSLQFSGHLEEYFAQHTQKLVVLIIMPRIKIKYNLLRVYRNGIKVKEKRLWSSENRLLFYVAWYLQYWQALLTYFDNKEKIVVVSFHPISFFGSFLQKRLRNITFAFWLGDYFPPVNIFLKLFEMIKRYYHRKISPRYYLSDRLNKMYNGKLIHTTDARTVMWGVKAKNLRHAYTDKTTSLLFVGLIKESQGLEQIFKFLSTHSRYYLNIVGVCEKSLYLKYLNVMKQYSIEKQVFFPNKFYLDKELDSLSISCQVGVALYDTGKINSTYYADPGKIKAYLEMGLPVVMSDTSVVANFVRRFHCGEVIETSEQLPGALYKIASNYAHYKRGVQTFLKYFNFESYYHQAFKTLEFV